MAESPERPPSPSNLSRTPSWVLLGFVLGAGFVWSLPRPAAPAPAATPPPPTVQLARPVATDIEAVFHDWGRPAVWDRDLTEVALWDVDRRSYSICYEILRAGDVLYFRSIPKLTRPVLTHGVPHTSPNTFVARNRARRKTSSSSGQMLT